MAAGSVEIKQSFDGGLDLDTSYNLLRKNCYVDALNIARDAISGNDDNNITNIVGNQLRDYDLPDGDNTVIGAFPYPLRNTVIYFVYNSNGKHSVLQFSNTTKYTVKIFEDLTDSDDVAILGLTITGKITSVNIFPRENGEGDLLFFLDSLGRPTTMNIDRFIDEEYSPVTRDIIDVGKRPPLSPPTSVYGNEPDHTVNNTRNKLFRFAYRWVYDDFEKSTLSPTSAVPLPVNALDDEYTNVSTNNNQISVSVNSGPKNVAKIELLMSFVNKTNVWSDFALVESLDKAELGIDDDTDYTYLFYNDATYPVIDINESILLFDSVPVYANAQEMPNGNVLTYAGITEGYNRTLEPNVEINILTVEAGNGGTSGGLYFSDSTLPGQLILSFFGIPIGGTVITVILNNLITVLPQTAASYTSEDGDNAATVANAIKNSALTNGFSATITGNTVRILFSDTDYSYNETTIVAPTVDAEENSTATWKWSTQRSIGIVYYDQKGVTNGVLYNQSITFPEYAETGADAVLLPYINTKIFHVPPDWAYSYQWVITKEPTLYLFWLTIDVNISEAEYLYFDISNMTTNADNNLTTANVLNWSFVDGDRMRLIKRDSDNVVYDDSYDAAIEGILDDPSIGGSTVTGKFVKIKKIPPFAAVDYSSDNFVIELYRPGQSEATEENQVYYEFGQQFDILNPTTETRVHAGLTSNQSTDYVSPAETDIYNGDSYFRIRNVYLTSTTFGEYFCQDRNFVDNYISAVSSIDGRPLIIDTNAKRGYYSATGRFGQAYQANTNINGLNRFYPNNFYDVDISYGDIMRLLINDRQMWVFQKYKTGQMPIFSQINKEPDGTVVNVVTDQLLNPIDYYAGNWGINDATTSLVRFDFAAYFCDTRNGVILRLSRDGLTPISILYNIDSWANRNLPIRSGAAFIYGAYDQRLNNYIIALEEAVAADAIVIGKNGRNSPAIATYYLSISDIPSIGDALSLTLTDGDGVVVTYQHTVVNGDTLTSIMTDLYNQINAGVYFQANMNAALNVLFPQVAMSVVQVTSSNPSLFSGVASITYGDISYSPSQTLSFAESKNDNDNPSFESFLSFKPEFMCALGTLLISFKDGKLYTHDNREYNIFYDVRYESSITMLFNDQSAVKKTFNAIGYQSNGIWASPENGDIETSNVNPQTGLSTISNIKAVDYELQENIYVAAFNRDANSMSNAQLAVVEGDYLKGVWAKVKLICPSASASELVSLKMPYVTSSISQRNF